MLNLMKNRRILALILVLYATPFEVLANESALANQSHWAEGSFEQSDGANREHYNRAAHLPWKNWMGDWRDKNDTEQGHLPYAVADVVDDDSVKEIRWSVESLVAEWSAEKFPNQGMFLRLVDGRGNMLFASRENGNQELRPRLVLVGEKKTLTLEAVAGTYLTKSTYRSQGAATELRISSAPDHVLVRFDLSQLKEIGALSEATLVMHSTKQYGGGRIGVFRCQQGFTGPPSPAVMGLAARYPNDAGISRDDRVLFATDFESPNWGEEWTRAEPKDKIDTIAPNTDFEQFQPLQGRALRSRIAKGSTTALNVLYKFAEETDSEPGEIYFRYYVRLADDWNQTVQGGKLPGISGTYGRAGWGGRKSNGKNGWSARGLFKQTIPDGNPLATTTPIGFYCYHADMESAYGTNWVWDREYLGFLQNNRWYSIEQYCKLNTPGKTDGVLRAWVDGRLALEKTDVRFRLTDELKIEQIWMNVYHGGTIPSPYDQHVFIDNVVIAKTYIGPMRSKK